LLDLKATIENRMELFRALRDNLGRNAELSFQEYKTQNIIREFLTSIEISNTAVFNTGVVALMNEGESCLAVRSDMDALPVNGVSHACGHDYHMAVALGVCQILKDINYDKCIKFIFQPGEESTGGALPMIKEGVLTKPEVKNVIGFHIWPELPVGKLEVSPGPSMGSIDEFTFTFKGKGGHAAMPHKCINPIYPAMDFINTITCRSKIENDPFNPHVLTIANVNCGTANNVIADEAKVGGTLRTFSPELRAKLKEDIINSVKLSAEKYNCTSEILYDEQFPPLISDTEFTNKFIKATKKLLGDENVLSLEKTFAGEDFAYFAEAVPSVHFRIGIADDTLGKYPLHSPHFSVNDDALFYGIYATVNFILSLDNN
jgi:hippurate hydrolase